MNLITKTRNFLHMKRNGVSWKGSLYCFKGKLTDGDCFVLIFLACVCGILIVLSFSEYIDGIKAHGENMRVAAEYQQEIAIHHEATIASMLNGSVVINGRVVTMCQIGASGDCKR